LTIIDNQPVSNNVQLLRVREDRSTVPAHRNRQAATNVIRVRRKTKRSRAAKAMVSKRASGHIIAAGTRIGRTGARQGRAHQGCAGKVRGRRTLAARSVNSKGDAENATPPDIAKLAEEIGIAALDLAQRANAAGLSTLGFLLEGVALEAGAEAVTRRWPTDAAAG
jgi:hypothetical protein